MTSTRTVVITQGDTLVGSFTEREFPGDDNRFVAYQRADGLWLGVNPDGTITLTPNFGSYQAFQPATNAAFTFADRAAFVGGKTFMFGCVAFGGPLGPAA